MSFEVVIASLVKSVASFSIHPVISFRVGNFPSATRELARSGRKSWSTVGRKMSPSLLADVSSMKSNVRFNSFSIDNERRQFIKDGEVENESVALQPAAVAIADVALKLMFEAIVGSNAVDCMIAPLKGTGSEFPYARTCIPTLRPRLCQHLVLLKG